MTNDEKRESVPNDSQPAFRTYLGVFLTSSATLLLEVTLTRIFSFTIWYHFAFITLAFALLGFGASGSVLAFLGGLRTVSVRTALAWCATASALGVVLAVAVISQVPFNPFDLLTNSQEMVHGLIYLAAITVPFFFAGMTIALVLSRHSGEAPRLYFADLVGAGAGCMVPPLLLPILAAQGTLMTCIGLYCLAALAFAPRGKPLHVVAALLVGGAGLGMTSLATFSPCKSKIEAWHLASGADVIFSQWSPVFRTDLLDWSNPEIMRGRSYGEIGVGQHYEGPRPELRFIAHDGDACAVMIRCEQAPEEFGLFQEHILGLPYQLRPGADVFVGGVGGGADVLAALANGAQSVEGVELDPLTVRILTETHGDYIGNICTADNVSVRAGEARSELRRSGRQYDVIQFSGVDTIASVAAGAHLLSESYLYTVESIAECFDHLTPTGILCHNSWDYTGQGPASRMCPRICALIVEALERRGVANPAACVMVVMAPLAPGEAGCFSILARPEPFSDADVAQVRQFAEYHGFDLWHLPGEEFDTTSSTVLRLDPDMRQDFFAEQYLDLSPTTDDKPFFTHFYKWRSLLTHHTIGPRYFEATGNLVLLGSLAISLLGVFALIVLPTYLAFRRDRRAQRPTAADLVYFCAIGIGFMFLEIALIQRLVMFLGYPTYSLTVSLFSVLVFAGLGSYWSRRITLQSARPVVMLFVVLAVFTIAHIALAERLFDRFILMPLPVRILITVAAIAPLGAVLGTFFPLGIRDLGKRNDSAVPLAWAANGSCSVLGTGMAVILATSIGFRATFGLALVLYLLAVIAFARTRRHAPGA